MHLVRGHQADPGVVVVLVVPIEEFPAKASGVLDAAEAFGKARLVFQRLEVAFGKRGKSMGNAPFFPCADSVSWILYPMCRRRPSFPR
jgi:hypothetical protein